MLPPLPPNIRSSGTVKSAEPEPPTGTPAPGTSADDLPSGPASGSPVVKFALNVIGVLAAVGLGYAALNFYTNVASLQRVTELDAGQCVEDFFSPAEGEFQNVFVVTTTNCANPHAYEVFTTSNTVFSDVTESSYPGVEETFAVGQDFCRAEYDAFVSGDFVASPWQVWTFVPTELRWDRGERKVQCLVGDAMESQLVEGSLEGWGR